MKTEDVKMIGLTIAAVVLVERKLETKINELRNKVQKTEAERDHYHRERDIWVRSNKQLQEQLASVKKERDELKAYWFDDADPSETKYANEYALAKVGAAGGVK